MSTPTEIPFPRGTGSIAYLIPHDYVLELKRRELTLSTDEAAEYLRAAAKRHLDANRRAIADDLRYYGPRDPGGRLFRGRTHRDKSRRAKGNRDLAVQLDKLAREVDAYGLDSVYEALFHPK